MTNKEQKDPDEGLELRPEVVEKLRKQIKPPTAQAIHDHQRRSRAVEALTSMGR